MAEDDLLPPESVAVVVPPAAPRSQRNITCEFCECVLAPSGDYIRLSEKAKELRKLEEKIEDLKSQLEKKDREIAELKAAAVKPEQQRRKGFFSGNVGE